MTGLCLLTLAGTLAATLPAPATTLAWVHSVEKIEWQEDWRATTAGLELEEARVRGSGAGMEPGEGAVLRDGWWRWRPSLAPQQRLVLARSSMVPDHRLCFEGDCRPLGDWLPQGAEGGVLVPCRAE